MRTFVALLLVALFAVSAVAATASDFLVSDPAIIAEVNENPKATWVAGENEVFKGKTFSQIKHMLGAFLVVPETNRIPKFSYGQNATAPKEFDARKQWPNCIHEIRNQGQCGSCWAFATTESMSDRFCIASQGKLNNVLSPQDMVSCDKQDYGCQGGYLDKMWQYVEQYGLLTEKCFPYVSGSGQVPPCITSCKDGSPFTKYKAVSGSTKNFEDIESAMTDISTKGPIISGFKVYRDFFNYKSGVYRHLSGGFAGGHAVKVVGWGTDSKSGLDYWIVANSWGTTWGMDGFFWIEKGHNECDFEVNLYVADPQL